MKNTGEFFCKYKITNNVQNERYSFGGIPQIGIIIVDNTSCNQLIRNFVFHIISNGNSIFTVMMGGRWFSSTLGDNPSVARVEELAVEHLKRIIRCDKTPVR